MLEVPRENIGEFLDVVNDHHIPLVVPADDVLEVWVLSGWIGTESRVYVLSRNGEVNNDLLDPYFSIFEINY